MEQFLSNLCVKLNPGLEDEENPSDPVFSDDDDLDDDSSHSPITGLKDDENGDEVILR